MTTWNELIKLAEKNRRSEAPKAIPETRITYRQVPERIEVAPGLAPSQHSLARDLAEDIGPTVAYTEGLGWFEWNGSVWERVGVPRNLAEQARGFLETRMPVNRNVMKELTHSYMQGVIAFMRTDPRVWVDPTHWDVDKYAVNTPAGVVDLYTGEIHAPDSRTLVTKSTTVSPDFEMRTPLFDRLLSQAFAGDQEASEYVITGLGLSLIGSQDDQIFFMLNGPGGSGKGTIMNIAQGILGTNDTGYSGSIEATAFIKGRPTGHPTEIARLWNKRMVVSSELPEHVTLDTARLKNITGGDVLTGRFMGKDFFDFEASHTLWIMTNYRPHVAGDDSGFWRRLREIPFVHTPPTKILGLAELIVRDEGPGVLGKMIKAASKYLHEGMLIPDAVMDAIEANKAEQDTVTQFIEDECFTGSALYITNDGIQDAYFKWCKANKVTALTGRKLGAQLVERGYPRFVRNGKRGHDGIALQSDDARHNS